jgi:CubicO group peptidase (beta-lactamase class C family)
VFPPGERYEYSNPGYEVLGLIVERASGMSFGEFLQANLFEPLGMSTAAVRESPEIVVPDRAVGYSPDSVSGGWTENDDHWLNWIVGAGGVYASLEDLYAWDQALWEWGEQGDRLAQVFAPAVLNDGTTSLYGFGWQVSDHMGRPAVHHTGGWVGFRTAIVRFTDERLTVVVLTNSSGPVAQLRDSVAAIYLGG